MKVPPKRKGNLERIQLSNGRVLPSMKVPPKRKGNASLTLDSLKNTTLNESPSEKEGKSGFGKTTTIFEVTLNESPSEKEGK